MASLRDYYYTMPRGPDGRRHRVWHKWPAVSFLEIATMDPGKACEALVKHYLDKPNPLFEGVESMTSRRKKDRRQRLYRALATTVLTILAFLAGAGLAATLAGCDPAFGINTAGYDRLETPLEEAWPAAAAFAFIPDQPGEGVLSPREFEAAGGGDCEDFAAYLVYLLGPQAELALVAWVPSTTATHAAVVFRGAILEPQVAGLYYTAADVTIVKRLSYNETMWAATRGGTRAIAAPEETP